VDTRLGIEIITRAAMVHLCRQVPWGAPRDQLEAVAKGLRQEASRERGLADNFETAAALDWKADLHDLAAQVRFPRKGDQQIERMMRRAADQLRFLVVGGDEEDTSPSASGFRAAVRKTVSETRNGWRTAEHVVVRHIEAERIAAAENEARQWLAMEPANRKENRMEAIERFGRRPTREDRERRQEQRTAGTASRGFGM